MDLKLESKKALITGSTSGIGFATARILLQEKAAVMINGRSQQSVDAAIEKLKEEFPNGKISGVAIDFEKKEMVGKAIKAIPEIDILINNVGIYKSDSFFTMADEDWYQQFEVNVMSGVRLSRHLLPTMLQKNWGRILFISSECATLVPPDMLAYSMTKTALVSIAKGLAQLTKGTQVTVNSVLPGSTLSEGAENFLESEAQKSGKTKQEVEANFFKEVRTSSLIQRFSDVNEVATTIVYLSSPLASATNGAAIKVEGGSTGGLF